MLLEIRPWISHPLLISIYITWILSFLREKFSEKNKFLRNVLSRMCIFVLFKTAKYTVTTTKAVVPGLKQQSPSHTVDLCICHQHWPAASGGIKRPGKELRGDCDFESLALPGTGWISCVPIRPCLQHPSLDNTLNNTLNLKVQFLLLPVKGNAQEIFKTHYPNPW